MPHFQLALLLGMTVALGPLALDAYLPAFPAIAADLGVKSADVGLTLSAYVVALGLAQLVGGPLSDRYGRQRILLGGMGLFAVAAFMVSQASSLQEMLLWRMTQGVGGAFCAVSVPAIVRDTVSGNEAARLFSLIGLIMFIAPAAAPGLGTLLMAVSGWPAIFVVLSLYALLLGLVLHLLLFRRLPERKSREHTPMLTMVTNYWQVLSHPVAMRLVLLQSLAFSVMLVFITHASFIYQEWFGLTSTRFSLLFAANIAVMAVINLINRRLLLSRSSIGLLRVASFIKGAALLGVVFLAWSGASYWTVAVCIMVAVGCMGAIVPNNMANALEFFPHIGGTASALLGATQFTLAGSISALSAAMAPQTLLPVTLTMALCAMGSVLLAAGAPAAVRAWAPQPGSAMR
ncbi:MAG: multidrug effflux MFS transporter [Oleiphilaceae bacterium]|nr:multidrug effflux MFS transporter [Oleiphilaceae bacterium]